MSALTSLFTSMANKIRSKVGGSNTYTPTEMVSAIDDVYDAGVASATTPITPSNSSPASMTSGTGYKPTANGYAIASYYGINPLTATSLVDIQNNKMYKGEADCYGILKSSYLSQTPSNSSPAGLRDDKFYSFTESGVAIKDFDSVTPSNVGPVSLTSGNFYKMGGSGCAIESFSTKTPSDTNPPSIASGAIIKVYGSGYFYASQVHLKPGRVLFTGVPTAARTNTSWTDVTFSTTSYDPSGTVTNTTLDPKFGHIDNGNIVVDYAIPTAYLAGYVMRGVTSSGSAVYGGVQILKNGSVISGASCYGSSSTASPSFRRITTSFAVGDIIKIQTRVSSTTQAYIQPVFNIQWEG